jgi:putative colanic acid biosynthesis acetyltransferase WcaF
VTGLSHPAAGVTPTGATEPEGRAVRLDLYDAKAFDRGRPRWFEALWLLAQSVFLDPPVWGSRLRVLVLRSFGARIGQGVTVKPGVRVKFPWRLQIGDHCWIGEDVWLDNLAEIRIGDHCCLSQAVYLCTGSHDWSRIGFDLMVKPIVLENEVWLAARSIVGPGATAGRGAVLALGSVATCDLLPWHIHQGVPASPVKPRRMRGST